MDCFIIYGWKSMMSIGCAVLHSYETTLINMSYDEILDNIKKRDYNDMHKPVGALIRTDDQIYIDSSNLTVDEEVDIVLKYVKGDFDEENDK